MKKFFITLAAFILTAAAAFANDEKIIKDEDIRQAIYGALDKAAAELKNANLGKAPIAVYASKQYQMILSGRLKTMLNNAGYTCIEEKDDPFWNELINRIEWNERKEDILDPTTIMKFGKLKAAKVLFQCYTRHIDKNSDRVYVELDLRATEINTAKNLWSTTVSHRHYIGEKVQGIVAIDNNLAELLKKNFQFAHQSLISQFYTEKLKNVRNIAVIPLSGDVASYLTQLTIEMISRTKYLPKHSPIPSLAEARIAVRDGLLGSDAICFGSVRSLHTTRPAETIQYEKKTIVYSWNVVADIQIFIEDTKGNILWSAAIRLNEPVVSARAMTPAEIEKYRGEKLKSAPSGIKEWFYDNWGFCLIIAGCFVGAIVLIICLTIAFKAIILYNHVR